MNDDDIVIVSTGCATALGPNAEHTIAEVFAGNTVASKTPFRLSLNYVSYAAVLPRDFLPEIPDAMEERPYFTRREGLLLRFATLALKDCLNGVVSEKITKTPPVLFIAFPEHETEKPFNPNEWLDDFSTLNPNTFQRPVSETGFCGRAGGLLALNAAIDSIKSGTVFALVGGVDTLYDTYIMRGLGARSRIKCEDVTDFFIPGEGAGFVLITTRSKAVAAGFVPVATIKESVFGVEKGPPPGYNERFDSKPELEEVGGALTQVISNIFERIKPETKICDIYSTMNGESYWGREWMVARVNSSAFFDDKAKMHHPAEFYGDIGAASVPVLIAVACFGLRENKHKSPILIYASSDKGERAATLLTSPMETQ